MQLKALSRTVVLAAVTLLAACASISTGDPSSGGGGSGSGSGTGTGTSSTTSETGEGGVGGVQGTGCVLDMELGIQLCASTSECPAVVVDPDALPGCGFRITNGTYDLQCDCNGLMCPIGTPTTCAQAASLLANQTQLTICQQLADGRCITPATPASTNNGSGSNGGSSSTCDQNCAMDCNSNPNCLTLCGC